MERTLRASGPRGTTDRKRERERERENDSLSAAREKTHDANAKGLQNGCCAREQFTKKERVFLLPRESKSQKGPAIRVSFLTRVNSVRF